MRGLIALLLAGAAYGANTEVQDTIRNGGSGHLATCTFVIFGPNVTATFSDGSSITPSTTVTSVVAGALDVFLQPNDQMTPVGTYYTVQRQCAGQPQSTETWVVPTSVSAVPVSTVRVGVQPVTFSALPWLRSSAGVISPATASDIVTVGATVQMAAPSGGSDTAAFTAALAYSAVKLGCGTYLIDANTSIASGVEIIGAGQKCTTLRMRLASSNPLFAVTASNVTFRSVTIDATLGTGDGVSVSSGLSNVRFLDVAVLNAANNCVTATSTSFLVVSVSTFKGCGANQFVYQVAAGTNPAHLRFENSTFDGSAATTNAFVSLFITSLAGSASTLADVIVVGNTIVFNGQGAQETDGLVVNGLSTSTVSGVTISANTIIEAAASTSGNAVEMSYVSAPCSLSGNSLENAYNGILIENASVCTLSGNNVTSSIANGASSAGISLVASNAHSTGDVVTGTYKYGILAGASGTSGVSVVGDTVNLSSAGVTLQVQSGDVSILGNILTLPPGGGAFDVVLSPSSLSNVMVRDNHITGGTYGFVIGTSTFTNVILSGNTFNNVPTPWAGGTYSAAGLTIIDDPAATRTLPAPTISGCSASIGSGSTRFAGSYTSGTSGTCAVTITTQQTVPNGASCWAADITTPADVQTQTASSATTFTLGGTTANGDTIRYGCAYN